MDFTYLLELAKENEKRNKSDDSVKFSTKVSNPKKVIRPGPKGNAIKNVLDKKNEERKKKQLESQKKKDALFALRADNKHSRKRVFTMINRVKGASKSVLDDAKDITTAKGEEQCDEDDYGYESTMSQQIFSKLQDRYSEIPDDERLKIDKTPKKNLEDTKNRVLNSLKQKHEEDIGVRKRHRKRKNSVEEDDFINDGDSYKQFKDNSSNYKSHSKTKSKVPVNLNVTNYKSDKYAHFKYDKEKEKTREKPKIKKAQPVLSFEQLLKVAQTKHKEPLPIEAPLKKIEKKKTKELLDGRPMTAKEKQEYEEEKIRKLRRLGKLPPLPTKTTNDDKVTASKGVTEADKSSNAKINKEKSSAPSPPVRDRSKYFAIPPTQKKGETSNSSVSSKKNSASNSPKEESLKKSRLEEQPPKHSRPLPPPASKRIPPLSKPFPPRDPHRRPPPPSSFKRRIDSDDEDEYDSEMDDFIDDGDADIDYSSEIARMFKYDKNKFSSKAGMDEDVDDMEVSYSQLQKEEKMSARIGLMEDLEDIKREEEEKKRKKMMALKGKRK